MSPALHRRLRRDNETDTQPTGAEADTRPSSFHAENITVSCAQLGRLAGQGRRALSVRLSSNLCVKARLIRIVSSFSDRLLAATLSRSVHEINQ